jgi:putative acetyltransferase
MLLGTGAQPGRFAGQWQDGPVADFQVRAARPEDAPAMAALFAAVAGERDGIATEPPVDVAGRTVVFARSTASTVVAEAAGQVVGMLHVEASRHGFGELGMLVDRAWRGRGAGSALLAAAADMARDQGLHKLCLEVFARNAAAIAVYRKAGYAEEGRRVAQYRRASGERWDTIVMGLLL